MTDELKTFSFVPGDSTQPEESGVEKKGPASSPKHQPGASTPGQITRLQKQQNRDRISVYVGDKYSFSLNLTQFADSKLKKGQKLSKKDIQKYKDLSDYGKLLEKTLNWCLMRPHSERELKDYLYRKTDNPDFKQKLTDYVLERGYVDNTRFTQFWCESRIRSKKPSRRKLTAELFSKGVDSETINSCLNDLGFSEADMLKELIIKKQRLNSLKNDPQKLKSYLVRQGFSYSDVNEALKEFTLPK